MPIDLTLPDDVLRQELFDALVAQLNAVGGTHAMNRTPTLFAINRNGNVLTVRQGQGQRFLQGALEWRFVQPPNQDEPWTFSVSRAAGNPPRLAVTPNGTEGTPEEIFDFVIGTFVNHTAPSA